MTPEILYEDNHCLVVNKPAGGISGITNTVALASGMHDIEIAFYQGTSSYGLYADVAMPGGTTSPSDTTLR